MALLPYSAALHVDTTTNNNNEDREIEENVMADMEKTPRVTGEKWGGWIQERSQLYDVIIYSREVKHLHKIIIFAFFSSFIYKI